MNFQEQLKQQLGAVNQGGFDDNSNRPDKLLKHPKLYFDKNTSTLMVRILPPTAPDKSFAEGFRSMFLEAVTDTGKPVKSSMQLSLAPDLNSPLENAINSWASQGLLPNPFNPQQQQKPSSRFLVNAVQVQINPQDGTFNYETDPATGQLMVRVLELPQSAFSEIGTKLQEISFAPPQAQGVAPEVSQYSFISESNAYAVQIVKPARGSGKMSYDVNVMQSVQLGALPQGWQALCEDLALQAQPTEVHSGDFVTNFIGWFNTKANNAGSGFGQQANYGGQPNFNQQPKFNQQQQQPNFGGQQNFSQQGQVQNQQNFVGQPNPTQQVQTQQNFGQATQQQNFGQPNPTQQVQNPQNFGQPVDTQGAGAQNNTGYVDTQNVADVSTAGQVTQNQVSQQSTGQVNQATNNVPAQDMSGGVPEQPNSIPNVDDLLNQMQGLS